MIRLLAIAAILSFFALLARMVLTASPVEATPVFTRFQFNGTAQSSEAYGVSYPRMQLSASGSGSATVLSQFTLVYRGELSFMDLSTVESAQFIGSNGDSINVTGVGQATESMTPGIYNLVQIYKVTGGSGRFTGAQGTITMDRTLNLTSGLTYSTFEGYLLVPSQK